MNTLAITNKLSRIISLCENPHWTSDRKERIAQLAREVRAMIEAAPLIDPAEDVDEGDGTFDSSNLEKGDCQLCGCKLVGFFYDAQIPSGTAWGYVCVRCFLSSGAKLGTKYVISDDGKSFRKAGG